jgi:hypothetical protein
VLLLVVVIEQEWKARERKSEMVVSSLSFQQVRSQRLLKTEKESSKHTHKANITGGRSLLF